MSEQAQNGNIYLSEPVTTPAIQSTTYDEPWFLDIHVLMPPPPAGGDAARQCRAVVSFCPWNRAEDKHLLEAVRSFEVDNLLELRDTDPDFAELWERMVAYLRKAMISKGLAASDPPPSSEPIEE